jgi:hypothetical protein
MPESFLHNHSLDVTVGLRHKETWNWISGYQRQKGSYNEAFQFCYTPVDLTTEPYGSLSVTTPTSDIFLYKRKCTGSRIGLHMYTNNDGKFVQSTCVGRTELWTKVTWLFSRIVVLRPRPPPHPPPPADQILLPPTLFTPSLPRRWIARRARMVTYTDGEMKQKFRSNVSFVVSTEEHGYHSRSRCEDRHSDFQTAVRCLTVL